MSIQIQVGYQPEVQKVAIEAASSRSGTTIAELQKTLGIGRREIIGAVTDAVKAGVLTLEKREDVHRIETACHVESPGEIVPVAIPHRVVIADFGPEKSGPQGGTRPGVVVNACELARTQSAILVPLTSQDKSLYDNRVILQATERNGLSEESIALCDNIQTISKNRISHVAGHLTKQSKDIQSALSAAFALGDVA